MEDKISIVVPIFKVEKYIKECIDSIINQSYENLEIILIDDESPDDCGKICDEYAQRDNRIIVIHQKNGGLSDARNTGIKVATGNYIAFVDSDDFIEKDYIKLLYEACKKNNTLISQCAYRIVYDEEKVQRENFNITNFKIYESKEMILNMYSENARTLNVVVWNKLYKRELFDDVKYPKGKIHEDQFTTYKLFYKVDKVTEINNILYNYRRRKNSIMKEQFNIKRLDYIEALEERINFFYDKKEKDLYEKTLVEYLEVIIWMYLNVKYHMQESKNIQKQMLKKYKKNCKEVYRKNIEITKKQRMRYLIFYIMPNVYFMQKKRRMKHEK